LPTLSNLSFPLGCSRSAASNASSSSVVSARTAIVVVDRDRALDVGGAPTVNSLDALFLGRFGVDASATFARSVRMGRFDVGGDVGASDVLARREASREDV
tara:strand:- start:109 stop:411 length:303 start_codon:yes stop_codon:yes gene_type:complete